MTTATRMKFCLGDDTRAVVAPKSYVDLAAKLQTLFKEKLPQAYKICYVDRDGDMISVTNQTDYDLALAQGDGLKFMIQPPDSIHGFELVENPSEPKKPAEVPKLSATKSPQPISAPIPVLVPAPAPVSDLAPDPQPAKKDAKEEEEKISSEPMQDIYKCLHCNGTKVNKKGRPCKKCKGTGMMTKALVDRVRSIVKLEVSKMFESEVRSHASQLIKSQQFVNMSQAPAGSQQAIHPGVKCDGCGITPIRGVRYKCATCSNYDLCETCEQRLGHEHALLKIRTPAQKPAAIFTTVNEAPAEPRPAYRLGGDAPKGKLRMKRLDENMKGENVLASGEQFVKSWLFQNSGTLPWPTNTVIVVDSDSQIIVDHETKVGEVKPEDKVEVKVTCKAPANAGKFVAFFQLSADGQKFGERVWAEITVRPDEESSLKLAPQAAPADKSKEEEQKKKASEAANKAEQELIAALVKRMSNVKIPEEYLANLSQLVQMFPSYDAEVLLDMLRGSNNNVSAVCELINSTIPK